MYSGFNVMTYIFPVDDVIEGYSYRFVRELLAREYLPIVDEKRRGQVRIEAVNEVERASARRRWRAGPTRTCCRRPSRAPGGSTPSGWT